MMTREVYLAFAKTRALRHLDAGDLDEAYTSMASDLSQHGELRAAGEKMDKLGMLYLTNRDAGRLRDWIEGFR
jgi:hypothetical protein